VQNLLDRMVANTHGYLDGVNQFLAQREGTLTEIFNAVMPGIPFTLKAMKMMQILTTLKYLREQGKVTLRNEDGKLVWSAAR
jgi:hypothetical protein